MTLRIDNCFETLKLTNKKALITFLTAGDPNYDLSLELIKSLPEAGADIIEIGMPFSDPMADGPAIQASSLRAINSGHKMEKPKNLELMASLAEKISEGFDYVRVDFYNINGSCYCYFYQNGWIIIDYGNANYTCCNGEKYL